MISGRAGILPLLLLTVVVKAFGLAQPSRQSQVEDREPAAGRAAIRPGLEQLSSSGHRGDEDAAFWYQARQALSAWNHSGITQHMVEAAHALLRDCAAQHSEASWLRFQVVDNKLFVEHDDARPTAAGSPSGGGWRAGGMGRIPHAILALLDVLQHFPGQVPDLDAVLSTHEDPEHCIPLLRGQPAPPVFCYGWCAADTAAIPFPNAPCELHERELEEGQPGSRAARRPLWWGYKQPTTEQLPWAHGVRQPQQPGPRHHAGEGMHRRGHTRSRQGHPLREQVQQQEQGGAGRRLLGVRLSWHKAGKGSDDIALQEAKFLDTHLQTLQALREVLQQYAALQRYIPAPGQHSQQYTEELLLKEFGGPALI